MADGPKTSRSTGPLRKYVMWVHNKFDFSISIHHYFTFVGQRTLKVNLYYYCFRWVMVFLFLTSSIITIADLGNPLRKFKRSTSFYFMYFIYMTNLSLTLNTVQASFGVFIMTVRANRCKMGYLIPLSEDIGRFRIVYWKLHELSVMAALTVSSMYWLVVYPVSEFEMDLNNIMGHVTNSLFAVIDWAVTGTPYNFSDIWIGWLYGTCYFIFNFIYWKSGGYARPDRQDEEFSTRVLYPHCSDWSKLAETLMCCLGFIWIMSMWHVLLCGLNRVRIMFWNEHAEDVLETPKSEPQKSSKSG